MFFSVTKSCLILTSWTAACQSSLSSTIAWSFLRIMSTESVMPSNHLILCRPLLLPFSIFPSIKVFFQWVSSSHLIAKVLELQLQHQSFRYNHSWFPSGLTGLSSMQSKGLASLLQHHYLKASILQHSAFFTIQLSHPYMTTGKTIALTIQTFVGKVISLLWICYVGLS